MLILLRQVQLHSVEIPKPAGRTETVNCGSHSCTHCSYGLWAQRFHRCFPGSCTSGCAISNLSKSETTSKKESIPSLSVLTTKARYAESFTKARNVGFDDPAAVGLPALVFHVPTT